MQKKEYKRDLRSPKPTSEVVSRVMSANKSKNTKPELFFRKELWKAGIRGYRLHWKNAPGKPDIAFPKNKIAVFINGCYWHRCPYCKLPLPKTNTEFWKNKFQRNQLRDKEKILQLKKAGWKVFVIWECKLKESENVVKHFVDKIEGSLEQRNN